MLHDAGLAQKARRGETLQSMHERIAALRLDLSGMTVLTEAATGAYACTAALAAMAGAKKIHALARDTARHGTAADAAAATLALAAEADVENAIAVIDRLEPAILNRCDIITNSGHLRPIDAAIVEALPATAVIALMFEAWEFRGADLDLAACRRHGIRVAAVNERHPDVAVFPFLGPLAVRLLQQGGMTVPGSDIAILCDNPFAPFIERGLQAQGAVAQLFGDIEDIPESGWDALILAGGPDAGRPDRHELRRLARKMPGALIAQFWGDLDRRAASELGFFICPAEEPRPGHMGILLNVLGDEPIIRLQAGGLRAASIVARGEPVTPGGVAELL